MSTCSPAPHSTSCCATRRTVRDHAEAIVDLSRRHGLRYWLLNGLIFRGMGVGPRGGGRGRRGADAAQRQPSAPGSASAGTRSATYACWRKPTSGSARPRRGCRVVAEAKELVARNEDRMWEAELARIEGELLRQGGRVGKRPRRASSGLGDGPPAGGQVPGAARCDQPRPVMG